MISGEDSGLYRLDLDTGALGLLQAGEGFLYGDLHACPLGVLAVRGSEDGDELILADHDDGKQMQTLVKSSGFLAAPCLREGRLAFLGWDADEMPWDGSRLQVATLTADGTRHADSPPPSPPSRSTGKTGEEPPGEPPPNAENGQPRKPTTTSPSSPRARVARWSEVARGRRRGHQGGGNPRGIHAG